MLLTRMRVIDRNKSLDENHYQSVKKCKGGLQGSGFALI